MTNQRWLPWIALLGIVLLEISVVMQVGAQEDNPARTVIGPSNIDLADGAAALQMGNAEDGVRWRSPYATRPDHRGE
jgi:hypothetical protein